MAARSLGSNRHRGAAEVRRLLPQARRHRSPRRRSGAAYRGCRRGPRPPSACTPSPGTWGVRMAAAWTPGRVARRQAAPGSARAPSWPRTGSGPAVPRRRPQPAPALCSRRRAMRPRRRRRRRRQRRTAGSGGRRRRSLRQPGPRSAVPGAERRRPRRRPRPAAAAAAARAAAPPLGRRGRARRGCAR